MIALAVFLGYERRRREPLVDLRFFRSLPFSGATLTAVSAMGALGGFLFLTTLYLQEVRGYRPLVAGSVPAPDGGRDGRVSPRWPAGWWPGAGPRCRC